MEKNLNPIYLQEHGSGVVYVDDPNKLIKDIIRTIILETNSLEEAKQYVKECIIDIRSKPWYKRMWYSIAEYQQVLHVLNKCTEEDYKEKLKWFLDTLDNSSYGYGYGYSYNKRRK